MFVDETAATTNMARRYGRRRRGQRLRCGVPHGHYKAITFVFGLRLRGVVAPKAYDHAMNAETFEAWLEHHLLPTLEEGDIVVLDTQGSQKPDSGGNPGQEKLHGPIPAALQPGLQPHRDGDLQTEKRAAKTRRAHRRRPPRHPGGMRRSLQASRLPKLLQGLRL